MAPVENTAVTAIGGSLDPVEGGGVEDLARRRGRKGAESGRARDCEQQRSSPQRPQAGAAVLALATGIRC